MSNPLKWHVEVDDDDLTTWLAPSIYHDDGSPFYFRICERPIGSGPCVTYYEASDAELLPAEGVAPDVERRDDLMASIQKRHDEMVLAEGHD